MTDWDEEERKELYEIAARQSTSRPNMMSMEQLAEMLKTYIDAGLIKVCIEEAGPLKRDRDFYVDLSEDSEFVEIGVWT